MSSAVPIEQLSAYSLNQVQQSLNKYNQDYKTYSAGNAWDQVDLQDPSAGRMKYRSANYGIEDEYRYLVAEKDFMGGKQPAAAAPPAAPAPGPGQTNQGPVQRDWTKPEAAGNWMDQQPSWWNEGPPQPVINFETPYQPVVSNRQTAVNNQSLKIDSNYTKPQNKGGTSGFKRSTTDRNYNTNNSMRLNSSLSV